MTFLKEHLPWHIVLWWLYTKSASKPSLSCDQAGLCPTSPATLAHVPSGSQPSPKFTLMVPMDMQKPAHAKRMIKPFHKIFTFDLRAKNWHRSSGQGNKPWVIFIEGETCGNALLSPETCPSIPIKKKDCIQQMPNVSLAKKNRLKKKGYKADNKLSCLVC